MTRSLLAVACIATLACAPQSGDTSDTAMQQMGSASDPATVQRSIDSSLAIFMDAMTKGDTVRMASVYAEDALVMPANGPAARGRAGIMHMNSQMLSGMSVPDAKIATSDLIVSGDYAIETGTYILTMRPGRGRTAVDTGKYVAVWKRQSDGGWKMIRDIFNSDKPAM